MAPKFNKFVYIKSNNIIKYKIIEYDSRNVSDCKKFNEFKQLHLLHLLKNEHITKAQYELLSKGSAQWFKDERHAVMQFVYYDYETKTYNTVCHYITRQPDKIELFPSLIEFLFGKHVEKQKPEQFAKDLYGTIYGKITDIKQDDVYSNFFNLNMDLHKLNFDEEKGYYVGPEGKQWLNLTQASTSTFANNIIKMYHKNGNIIKYDQTDLLYTHNAILKAKILKNDFSQKEPTELDEFISKIDEDLKCPDDILEKVKESILKKNTEKKFAAGIIDEE